MTIHENILISEFEGAVSVSIVEFFIKAAKTLIKKINAEKWGYISCSKQAEAATPDAEKLLIQSAHLFYDMGCVQSAYVLTSPIAISQVQKLRASIGIDEPLKNILFDDLQQAKDFILNTLQSYE
ncbi:hypothetical protein GCM10008107_01500 [Psychrosphaera saromensis]|nr:hypothetical protein GCM10008107_01500 [Psychrosphaera saromensis]GLQ13872.1 hypothetical protein GCM10007917_13270 [Psychrosphaera saromensis]